MCGPRDGRLFICILVCVHVLLVAGEVIYRKAEEHVEVQVFSMCWGLLLYFYGVFVGGGWLCQGVEGWRKKRDIIGGRGRNGQPF